MAPAAVSNRRASGIRSIDTKYSVPSCPCRFGEAQLCVSIAEDNYSLASSRLLHQSTGTFAFINAAFHFFVPLTSLSLSLLLVISPSLPHSLSSCIYPLPPFPPPRRLAVTALLSQPPTTKESRRTAWPPYEVGETKEGPPTLGHAEWGVAEVKWGIACVLR